MVYWTQKQRWLAVVLTGYIAWVVPYDIRQYTSFLAQTNPGLHSSITLGAIVLICATLVVVLLFAVKEQPFVLGITVAAPWLLISLVCDFGLDTYYRNWEPNISAYLHSGVWQFILVPVGSILAGVIFHFYWKPKDASQLSVTVVERVRK